MSHMLACLQYNAVRRGEERRVLHHQPQATPITGKQLLASSHSNISSEQSREWVERSLELELEFVAGRALGPRKDWVELGGCFMVPLALIYLLYRPA